MNVLLSLLLLLMPAVKPETGKFNILKDGRKIGTEEFTISTRGSGYTAEARTRISANGQNLELRSRMELDAQLFPTYYEVESKGNVMRLKVGQPYSELEIAVQGRVEPHDVRFPSGAAILDQNFFHHYLLLLYRQGISGATVSTLEPQTRRLGTILIRSAGDRTYELETTDVKLVATTDAEGRLVRLTVPSANVVVER